MNDNDPLTIPDDWSAQQALAIFDFLEILRQKVWLEYQEEIITQVRAEMDRSERGMENCESVDFDDDIDF